MSRIWKIVVMLCFLALFSCQSEKENTLESFDIPGVIVNDDGRIACRSISSALQLEPKFRNRVWLIVFNIGSNPEDMDNIVKITKFQNLETFAISNNLYVAHDTLNQILDMIYDLNMKKLREIEFLGTVKDSLPNSLYKFRNLESLKFGYETGHLAHIVFNEELQDIRYIDERILLLSNLRDFSSKYYFKDSIPEFIFHLNQLETFSFASDTVSPNNIHKVGEFKKLKSLYLYDVNLSKISFDKWIFNDLENIGLVNNNIDREIDFIKYSHSLHEIYIQNYPIVNIEDFFEYFIDKKNLRRLSLWNCNITNIPESIKNLSSLEVIVLFANPLEYIDSNLVHLKNLKHFYPPRGREDLTEPFIDKMPWCKFEEGLW